MELLMYLVAIALSIIVAVCIEQGIRKCSKSQPHKQDSCAADLVLVDFPDPDTVFDVIDNVPWEAGANILGECEVCTGIAEAGNSLLEILFDLLVW